MISEPEAKKKTRHGRAELDAPLKLAPAPAKTPPDPKKPSPELLR